MSSVADLFKSKFGKSQAPDVAPAKTTLEKTRERVSELQDKLKQIQARIHLLNPKERVDAFKGVDKEIKALEKKTGCSELQCLRQDFRKASRSIPAASALERFYGLLSHSFVTQEQLQSAFAALADEDKTGITAVDKATVDLYLAEKIESLSDADRRLFEVCSTLSNGSIVRAFSMMEETKYVEKRKECFNALKDIITEPLASKLLMHIPFDPIDHRETLNNRALCLKTLYDLKAQLILKYPMLEQRWQRHSQLHRGFEEKIAFIMTAPLNANFEGVEAIADILEELCEGDYKDADANILTKWIFNLFSFKPPAHLISEKKELKDIARKAMTLSNRDHFESFDHKQHGGSGDLFRFRANKKDKEPIAIFKPANCEGKKQAILAAKGIDDLLGAQLTPAVMPLSPGLETVLTSELYKIMGLFEADQFEAGVKAFRALPDGMRGSIYNQLGQLIHTHWHDSGDKGHKCFYNIGGLSATNQERAAAIFAYLESTDFSNFIKNSKDVLPTSGVGTLQRWVSGCKEAGSLMEYPDGKGGKILKKLPASHVQIYNTLGLLKGNVVDGHWGNTLIDEKASKLKDCDDEYGSPFANRHPIYDPLILRRLWSLGLPQAEEPFSKAFLMTVARANLPEKVAKVRVKKPLLNRRLSVQMECGSTHSDFSRARPVKLKTGAQSKVAFAERLMVLDAACREALANNTPLTSRDLLYKIYGGEAEIKKLLEKGVPPIVLFDAFKMQDPDLKDASKRYLADAVTANLTELYGMPPAKDFLKLMK